MRRLLLFTTTCLLISLSIPETRAINLENSHNDVQYTGFFAIYNSVLELQLDANLISNLDTTIQLVIEESATYGFNTIVNWVRTLITERASLPRPVSDSIVILETIKDTPNSTSYINFKGLNNDVYMAFRMKVNEQQ